jgi:hypothetical protein
MGRPLQNKQADYYQRANADRLGLPLQSRSDGRWQKDMKQIFWDRAEDARKLGSVAIACFAIVIWIGAKACFAFFERRFSTRCRNGCFRGTSAVNPDEPGSNTQPLPDRTMSRQHADFAEFLKVRKHIRVVLGMKIGNGKGKS